MNRIIADTSTQVKSAYFSAIKKKSFLTWLYSECDIIHIIMMSKLTEIIFKNSREK